MRNIILLFLSACCFLACDDLLDLNPENSLTFKNAFETEKDIESALRATEWRLRESGGGIIRHASLRGYYSDNVKSSPLLLQDFGYAYFTGYWENSYDIISSANVVLPFLDKVEMTQERRDFYRGEALFFKAFAYLQLIRCFGNCVLVKDEVILEPLGQTAWPIVADYAIELAKEAIRLLPEWNELQDASGNPVTHRGRPCKGAANAVLANLCAWKAGCKYLARTEDQNYDETALWKQVDSACSAIINRPDIYELADTPEEVCTSVLVGGSKESIFESIYKGYEYEFDYGTGGVNLILRKLPGYPVDPYAGMNNKYRGEILNTTVEKMFEEYEQNGVKRTDQRRYAWFYNYDEMAAMSPDITGGYAYFYKWRYPILNEEYGYVEGVDCNLVWCRLADIYLLRAESRYHLGNTAGAIEDLNTIRDRAGAKRYDASEHNGDLRYTIFKEREKELLWEGYRYFDVVRNGYYKTELYGNHRTLTEKDIIEGALFLAIPYSYMNTNSLLRQYPYWIRVGEKDY